MGRQGSLVSALAVLAGVVLLWRGLDGLRSAVGRERAAPQHLTPERTSAAPAAPAGPELRARAPESSPDTPARREGLTSAAGPAVLGTVVDPQGLPVAGATITLFEGPLFDRASAPRPRATLVSDASGRFRFLAPAREGRFGVRVVAAGFAEKSRDQSPEVDVPFELTPAVRVHGRILGAGAELARVFRLSGGVPGRVDDGRGNWSAEGLPLGRATGFELVPGDAAPRPFTLEPSEPGELVHDLVLGELCRFEGRVLDFLTRQPVAWAVLSSESELGAGRLAESDERGAFTVAFRLADPSAPEARGGLLALSAEAPGYLIGSIPLTRLARTGVVELVPGAVLEGHVLDADGAPVEGARVAWLGPYFVLDARFDHLRVPELAPVRSAPDGAFRLSGLPWALDGGLLSVELGTLSLRLENVAPEHPESPRRLEIRLPRGRALIGQLEWDDVSLVPHADLTLRRAGEPGLAPPAGRRVYLLSADGVERSAESDARGEFRFEDLPPGELVLALEPALAPERALRVPASSALVEHARLPVPTPTRRVMGVLREPDGTACAGAEVGTRLERRGLPGQGVALLGRTDELGAFAFAVPDFPFLVTALVVTRSHVELWHAAPGAALDWTLPELAEVELELADARPDTSHWLAWDGPRPDEGGRVRSRLRFLDGRLTQLLPVGELTLSVSGSDAGRIEQRLTVRPGPGPQRIALVP